MKKLPSGSTLKNLTAPSLGLIVSAGVVVVGGFTLLTPSPVAAQAAYGSYLGAAAAIGVTSGVDPYEGRETAAAIAFRYKFLKAPVSLRTQALIGSSAAIVPTISYDVPLNWNADVYVGAGAAIPIPTDGSASTPVGNQTAFAIQPGIDYMLPNSNLVLFGNAIIAFDAYRHSRGTAASLQVGAGVRF